MPSFSWVFGDLIKRDPCVKIRASDLVMLLDSSKLDDCDLDGIVTLVKEQLRARQIEKDPLVI